MRIIRTITAMRRVISKLRLRRNSIGFVPTMGFFHPGHVSLMKASVNRNDVTIVSLFVNPTQFGPKEDLARYPRNLKHDIQVAEAAGVDFIFAPSVAEMYPEKQLAYVDVGQIADILCGATRQGHFRGVATVVSKLLNIIQPDVMYLGQKDAQQVEVIKRMIKDLNFHVKITVCPTARERDGLAMSSRNSFLSPTERAIAPRLYQALCFAREMVADGQRDASQIIFRIKKLISDGTNVSIVYVSCVGLDRFLPVRRIEGKVLVAVAVKIGNTRLIDNIVVKAK